MQIMCVYFLNTPQILFYILVQQMCQTSENLKSSYMNTETKRV